MDEVQEKFIKEIQEYMQLDLVDLIKEMVEKNVLDRKWIKEYMER